ncbi:hypothetical protein UFOVP423_12 [uncultured Caudovirales phage]|jgi:hypothetical protein|uniref:Uncharacterized protein n=1 Tax=uncultured Caudovirales phage TaxID=2100421 RepID=A0A6J5M5G6_9CAUD|nr:hypothetical protein UFOVP423_12 [uncultured Caudovirales phage]
MMVKLDIGGAGEQITLEVSISGCDCRAEDFLLELVRFTNKFRAEADARAPESTVKAKPCGCKETKLNAE